MNSYVQGAGYDLAHIVDNWSWDELGSGTVVDVGGSEGFVCLALARKFPSLSFVVQVSNSQVFYYHLTPTSYETHDSTSKRSI